MSLDGSDFIGVRSKFIVRKPSSYCTTIDFHLISVLCFVMIFTLFSMLELSYFCVKE
uniref:Transmembrane protein n=1 Tax=Wuchereria bancrofti TaxID=6293 RepID=A0AAF5PHJ6_WUCBA